MDYRDSERFLTINKKLNDYLWTYIKEYLDENLENRETNRPSIPHDFCVLDEWKSIGIN